METFWEAAKWIGLGFLIGIGLYFIEAGINKALHNAQEKRIQKQMKKEDNVWKNANINKEE